MSTWVTFVIFTLLSLSSLPFNSAFRPKSLVLPVTKDPSTNQYVVEIRQRTPLVPIKTSVDLGGPFLWVNCDNYKSSTWKPSRCGSAQCNLARSKGCMTECLSPPRPGCTNNTCGDTVDNRWTGMSTGGSLGSDTVEMQSTNGLSAGRNVSASNILFQCGGSPALPGLATGATGVAGFGRNKVSLPYVLSSAFSFPKKFAICLSSRQGVIFFGGGPYSFLGSPIVGINFEQYEGIPLLLNPVRTGASFKGYPSTDYFIDVRSIKVNGKELKVNTTLLKIDGKGNGGTMLSTVTPYTVMESSIYNAVVSAFSFGRVVSAVAPFTRCFNSSGAGVTRLGIPMPPIELLLPNKGVGWTMFGMHSVVGVSEDVSCLAFVDGGKNPKTSIVIGSYQMEDSLIEFDLASSKLRSFILPARRTTCANFNFTANLQD